MMHFRDPDKPTKSTTRIVQVLEGSDLTITFNDTDISKTNLAGGCLVMLSTGDFLLNNGINRDNTGSGVKEFKSWFVQPGADYALVRADNTKYDFYLPLITLISSDTFLILIIGAIATVHGVRQ